MVRKTSIAGIVIALALLVGFGVLTLPAWQTLLYDLLIQTPAIPVFLGLGALVVGGLAVSGHPNAAVAVAVLTVVMAFIAGPLVGGWYSQEHTANNTEYEQVEKIPETDNSHPRVLPRAVADRYAESSFQYQMYAPGGSDITYHEGTYTWSKPIVPDKMYVEWTGSQHGAMFVNMETHGKDIDIVEQDVKCGMGQELTDDYYYQFVLNKPLVDHEADSAFVLQDEQGDLHIAQSYQTHTWHVRWTPIPMVYSVPHHGGVMVMDNSCGVTDLSPQEAASSELLKGQNFYPYDLAMYKVESRRMIHGISNAIFVGRDVPQIAEVSGQGNSLPFTVPTETEDGSPELTYYIPAEPTGQGNGIYQIYTMDSQTGAIEYVEYNDTMIGPQRATDFVRQNNPRVNWANGGSGTMEATEPIPVTRNNQLYWQVRVVPTDSTGITYTAFVNASNPREVVRVDGDKQLRKFISGGGVVQAPSDGNESTTNGLVTIAIVENGTVVDTITVTENQTIEISAAENSTQNQSASA